MQDGTRTLLVCTLGGSPEPIVASLKHWQPARVLFVATPESREQVESAVVPLSESEGFCLDPGRYDIVVLHDGQDFTGCIGKLEGMAPEVDRWQNRGENYGVVVDFTGGTKCMSAALALHAHRWRCVFSYVGGSQRTKAGVGVVVSGREQVLNAHNPWDALGFQAVEEFVSLFDQRALSPAITLAEAAMRKASSASRKREFSALASLGGAYEAWDRFEHKTAVARFRDLLKCENDLRSVLGRQTADRVLQTVRDHLTHVEALAEVRANLADCRGYVRRLVESPGRADYFIADLLANARRRADEGRRDDAVARLYRLIEAIGQIRLAERHGISNTDAVRSAEVPRELRDRWLDRTEDDAVRLGLQDTYELLGALDDDLAAVFKELGLADRERSALVARNQAILAHGFEPVSDKVFRQLWRCSLELASVDESELPVFPTLSSPEPTRSE